jgi:hypothetical protein
MIETPGIPNCKAVFLDFDVPSDALLLVTEGIAENMRANNRFQARNGQRRSPPCSIY